MKKAFCQLGQHSTNMKSSFMKYLGFAILLVLLESCGTLLGTRSDSACIQNNSAQPIIINTSPTFISRTGGYWEKFWNCPYKDSINTKGDNQRIYDPLKINCMMIIKTEGIYMQAILHDEKRKYGSYVINTQSIFDLGGSYGKAWPRKIIPLKVSDIIYDKIQIIVPSVDTITLNTKQDIYDFVMSSKYTVNKKLYKKLNKDYTKIVVIK
jgi:hypothetical protein